MICFNCGKYGHRCEVCPDKCEQSHGSSQEGEESNVSGGGYKVEEKAIGQAGGDVQGVDLMAKRSRDTKENKASDESQNTVTTALGIWNLVKRPARKKMEGAYSSGLKEKNKVTNQKLNDEVKQNRESRQPFKVVLNGERNKASFSPGKSMGERQFGKDILNEKRWVPAIQSRRKSRVIVNRGKENGVDNQGNKASFTSAQLPPKVQGFMNSNNPFGLLSELDETNNNKRGLEGNNNMYSDDEVEVVYEDLVDPVVGGVSLQGDIRRGDGVVGLEGPQNFKQVSQ